MECTQRLECTQDLYESRSERICPEQIGFLGICGVKHAVKRGPNKIGRDPQTCSIVLNLNSISRQHAVINVLNQTEYMLMDLDSANKTKLMDKTLPAYIPHPLRNGDMVQFGDVFGVFRLLEEDTDLPMTQALDMPETQIPETPIFNRHGSKMNKIPITTIPESPDVSDKDDSFIVPSQPKGGKCFRSSNSHFVKPSAKVISIQPVGTNKIDNVYWNSSKKSVSLNSQFNDSDSNLNDSTLSDKTSSRQSNHPSIYEMETQGPAPCEADDSTDSIYTANTQIPPSIHNANTQVLNSIHNVSTQDPTSINNVDPQDPRSINTAKTQIPTPNVCAKLKVQVPILLNKNTKVPASVHNENTQSPSIHSLNTQLPSTTNLPEVCKINDKEDMHINLYTSSKKQNNNHMFDAETQLFALDDDHKDHKLNKVSVKTDEEISKKSNISAEEIKFEEIDCQDFENDFESQVLLPTENILNVKEYTHVEINSNDCSKDTSIKQITKNVIIHSDSSTDCEDIDMLPTQKITGKQEDDEDVTDCEDLFDDEQKNPKGNNKIVANETKNETFEDMLTQVISADDTDVPKAHNKTTHDVNFEDMLTQVIVPDAEQKPLENLINIEDMPTQIIVDDCEGVIIADKPIVSKNANFEDLPTQVISDKALLNNVSQELVSPFKIPLVSPLNAKRKDIKVTPKSKPVQSRTSPVVIPDDDNYYAATQDILDDLCTQRNVSPNNVIKDNVTKNHVDFLPSSVEDYKVGNKFPHLENNVSPRKALNTSIDSSDGDENVNNFVSKLSSQQIRDVIGVEKVDKVKRVPSYPSDGETTPKKVRPIKFMDIDLPNSQEIKTSVSMYTKAHVTESSSESEVENDSEECTPILFRKKKRPKVDAKMDLTKVFAAETLPTRVITRVRKPTNKYKNEDSKTVACNILKPKFLTEQEDEIDKEIITENIYRLKSKSEKSKNKSSNKDSEQESKSTSKLIEEGKQDEKENASKSKKVETKAEVPNKSKHNTKTDIIKKKDDIVDAKTVTDTEKPKEKPKHDKNNDKVPKKESNHRNNKREKLKKDTNLAKAVSPNDSQTTNFIIETSIDAKTTRSTRNRRKVNDAKETCSVSVEEESQSEKKSTSKPSRKQNLKKTIEIDLTDGVVETRRSRRQQKPTHETKQSKPKDEKTDKSLEKADSKSAKPATRRGRPPKHSRTAKAEQSTVYSLSSESGTDSPKSILKRSATENLDPPSPKRTRSVVNSNTSLRATPARMNQTHYVLFTAFPCEEVKAKLEKLGAMVVTDVTACTVVLTLAVKRTFKLLCAVGLGRPIVGPSWVQACADTNTIVDPWLYILKDEIAEKRFQFSLEKTLLGKRNFLNGFNVSSTPSVMPNTAEMKLIVECSGGTWKEEGPQWICVSSSADRALWPALKRRGAVVVSTEFILGGVLRQRPDITTNRL